ncbi:retrovirus-related Pol polyprotein from transposon 17.6 [Trichonephila clavipes]|nr:retrovirus-related Pol polyprotein from transposon 17.6 [Trichonephila clavipes]
MTGWYQKFIPRYADICEPLYQLKKKGAKFNWSGEAQDSFDQIKRTLTEAPILQLPNFSEQFNLFTDASEVGIGAVLQQNQKPIAFASRTLNKAERNYTVTERECLAVIWALNKFKTYFGPLPVKVITDHAVLTKLTNARYGAPISLISDNGPQFISDVFEHLSHRLDIKHMKTVTYRPQANLTERVNRNLVQMIASFVEENHENWDQFLHEFAFALRTARIRNMLVGTSKDYSMRQDEICEKSMSWGKYYNRRRRDVHIKVNDLVLLQTHFLSAAGRKQVGKFMPKFESPYRVLEVKGNNLIIWKSGRKMAVNIDQVRVYRPRPTDTISWDSPVETLYDEQEVSHGSNRSNQEQFKEHRKTSSQISEGCRSRQGNTAREIPRNKRKLSQYESKD